YSTIKVERIEGIAKVIFNRPERMNAINPQLAIEVRDAMDKLLAEDTRVVVLTGNPDSKGRPVFSVGWDVIEAKPIPFRLDEYIEDYELPVIAMVDGYCLGGGNEIAMSCDFIFASDRAEFGQPEVNLGFCPGWGGTQRLSRIVGLSKAKYLCFLGDRISAKEAERIGLVNFVFPASELEKATMEFAKKLAGKPPLAIKYMKVAMNKGIQVDIKTALKIEKLISDVLTRTEDFAEGMRAFREKREPKWRGK
ncbi:MAG: enoyl-CoA hydratase/isomerase family protein, partial [Archaeoglobaceae archaeon]